MLKKRLKRHWKIVKDKEVLARAQATSVGERPDGARLSAIRGNLAELKELRDRENDRYRTASESLWLGDCGAAPLRSACSRETIGFVCRGSRSLRAGGALGVGYAALNGVRALRGAFGAGDGMFVLVRNTSSLQYRIARLEVVT